MIHEVTHADGSLEKLHLREDDGVLFLVDDQGAHPLPEGALRAVMQRYAKPLEEALPEALQTLALSNGDKLSHFRYLAVYDVIARDYIAYETSGKEPVCELATAVTAALSHLARAAQAGQ
ncbi:MAG: hypothetical protein ABI461_11035 [Polyangiaceae bacterium]